MEQGIATIKCGKVNDDDEANPWYNEGEAKKQK